MLRAGVDSRIVVTVLGHRSLNMMRRYAHVAPELVVNAAMKAHENAGGYAYCGRQAVRIAPIATNKSAQPNKPGV